MEECLGGDKWLIVFLDRLRSFKTPLHHHPVRNLADSSERVDLVSTSSYVITSLAHLEEVCNIGFNS
jgi:hypothetical protein